MGKCDPLRCVCGCCIFKQRYVFTLMAMLGVLNIYIERVVLNIALTEMVKLKPVDKEDESCHYEDEKVSKTKSKDKQYNWTEGQQQAIMSMFYVGYVLSHIPGGYLSDVYGAKYVFLFGVGLSALLTLLTPVIAVYGGWIVLAFSRSIVGVAQGVVFPCVSQMLSRWVPLDQRGFLGSLIYSGNSIGSILSNVVSSQCISYFKSWQVVYYIWGAVGLIWCLFFVFMCYSEPNQHPCITDEEKEYITSNITPKKKYKTPWRAIFSDKIVWGLIIGQFGHGYILFFVLNETPKYMKDVLKFKIKDNGVISAMPHVALWLGGVLSGFFCDFLRKRELMSLLKIRVIFTTVASVGPSVLLVVAGYMGCNRAAAIAMYILAMFTMGPFFPGLKVNCIDVSANFAGVIMALSNGLGAISGAISPFIVSAIAVDHTLWQWQLIYWIDFIIASITNIVYAVWSSVDQAEWDKTENLVVIEPPAPS